MPHRWLLSPWGPAHSRSVPRSFRSKIDVLPGPSSGRRVGSTSFAARERPRQSQLEIAGGCGSEGAGRDRSGRGERLEAGGQSGESPAFQAPHETRSGDHQRSSGGRDAEGNAGLGAAPGRSAARTLMRKFQYLVRIDKDPGSDWGASVPDLPGCVATGKTVDAALRRIERAAAFTWTGCAPTAGGRPSRDAAPSHRASRQAA